MDDMRTYTNHFTTTNKGIIKVFIYYYNIYGIPIKHETMINYPYNNKPANYINNVSDKKNIYLSKTIYVVQCTKKLLRNALENIVRFLDCTINCRCNA